MILSLNHKTLNILNHSIRNLLKHFCHDCAELMESVVVDWVHQLNVDVISNKNLAFWSIFSNISANILNSSSSSLMNKPALKCLELSNTELNRVLTTSRHSLMSQWSGISFHLHFTCSAVKLYSIMNQNVEHRIFNARLIF